MSTPALQVTQPLVSFAGVSVGYGGASVLTDVRANIWAGEIVAVFGRNGAGKTTLLHALFNLGPQIEGAITVKGRQVAGWPTHRIARLGLALVPQGRGVFPALSVAQNLRLATLARRAASRGWTLERVYDAYPRLYDRRAAASGALSGGERQLLVIARALLTQADLLVLDEPSEGLAPAAVEEVLVRHLGALASEGLTVLIAEQNVAAALGIASRALLLDGGRVVFDGPAAGLRSGDLLARHLGIR